MFLRIPQYIFKQTSFQNKSPCALVALNTFNTAILSYACIELYKTTLGRWISDFNLFRSDAAMPGGNTEIFLGDGTTKTCGHDCDQAHLVSWFTCNKRVTADASSNPPVSRLKLL